MILEKKSKIIINGKSYENINISNVSIGNNNIIIGGDFKNGEKISLNEFSEKQITIIVEGNVESLKVEVGNVIVKGNAGTINHSTGNIDCNDVLGNITNITGNIKANSIKGNASTVNGSIKIY